MRLLVAEIDSALAELLKSHFQEENFSVHLIAHSDHLNALPEDARFDLVLLDTNFPGLCVEDSLRAFLRRWPDAAIILLIGRDWGRRTHPWTQRRS